MVSGRPSRRRSRCRSVAASSVLRSGAFSASSLRASLTSPDMKTPNAIRSESIVRLWNADSSSAPSGENWKRRLIFLVASSLRFLSMMSPICSRLMAKETISIARCALALVEAAAGQLGHIELDRLVETVDAVVHPRDLIDQRAVVGHHRRHHLAQHDFDVIAHVQRFARGVGQRQRGRFQRALVEIARPRRIGFLDPLRQQLLQQPRHAVEQADEEDRGRDVEGDVEQRGRLGEIGLPGLQQLRRSDAGTARPAARRPAG